MKKLCIAIVPVLMGLAFSSQGREVEVSPPKGVSLVAYDNGFALATELRSAMFSKGENLLRFRQVPARLDPATVSVSFPGDLRGMEILEQEFHYDLESVSRLFNRYMGQAVDVEAQGQRRKGILLSAPIDNWTRPLAIREEDGSVAVLPNLTAVDGVVFPEAGWRAYLEPTLMWRCESTREGPQNFRLMYGLQGLTWDVSYEAVLAAEQTTARIVSRANISNGTGGRFENARVKLVSSGNEGSANDRSGFPSAPALRYLYGSQKPTTERTVAGADSLQVHDVAQPVSIEPGETVHLRMHSADKVPVEKAFVYDGVRFDRFQRNRRNDWNYGTEYHTVVESYLKLANDKASGLGVSMPPGRFRVYRLEEDGTVNLLGDDYISGVSAGDSLHVRVGPARGLKGERERTGYSEIVPLREYEESFQIRLSNNSSQEAEVRVVEHLYRWSEFEIVKADTEYEVTGPQTIEFRPVLKPGGRRSVHYTVRYRW